MNLLKRTFTAIVLIGVSFVVVQYGPRPVQFVLMQAFIVAALMEFYKLAARKGLLPQRALGVSLALLLSLAFYFRSVPLEVVLFGVILIAAFYFVTYFNTLEKLPYFTGSIAITILGTVYLSFTLNYLFKIRFEDGAFHVYFLASAIFLGDTGAMFIGKAFGRNKMTPIASPNKTWEGSLGGILVAIGGAVLAQQVLHMSVPLWKAVITGALIHAAAQVSDPLESLFKRAVGVKDSSNALPGHGGFLDRIDSLILATPLFYFIVRYFWK
jgi:phosphatidate cytidylyltransferase